MKIFKPADFPIEMNEENIEILANMMSSFPPLEEWRDISNLISYQDRNLIRKKIKEREVLKEKKRWLALTHEEQEEEKRSTQRSLKEGPEIFRGNILQQEWDSIDLARIEKEKREKDEEDESLD